MCPWGVCGTAGMHDPPIHASAADRGVIRMWGMSDTPRSQPRAGIVVLCRLGGDADPCCMERSRDDSRPRELTDATAALGGLGVAAGALTALLISERAPLFGFMEHGYRIEILIAIAAETIAIVALGTVLALTWQRR